jgi:hypothetical protein
MNRIIPKDIYVRAVLKTNYLAKNFFLPAGKKIYIYPNRKQILIFALLRSSKSIKFVYFPFLGIMTEEEMIKRRTIKKGRFFFLDAAQLYRALSEHDRQAVWPKISKKQNRRS